MIGDTATRVLLAVVNQRRPTVRSVAEEVGKSPSAAYFHLVNLRREGLVTWGAETRGTLRAAVEPIAQTFDPAPEIRYTGGTETSDPRTARTAGGLAEPYEGGSDMQDHSSPASPRREGRR